MKFLLFLTVICLVSLGDAGAQLLRCQLGILTSLTLRRNNPTTNQPWKPGDKYRYAFFTSASTTAYSANIADYNAWVQSLANASPLGIGAAQGVTWKAIGSTDTVDARDNTSTNPTINGTGCGIFRLDGETVVASNNNVLWGGTLTNIISVTELGTTKLGWPYTGTYKDGTRSIDDPWSYNSLGGTQTNNGLFISQGNSSQVSQWIWRSWTGDSPGIPQGMYALSEPLTIVEAPPKPLRLTITSPSSNRYALTWPCRYGKVYDLRSSTTLDADPSTWPIISGYTGMAAAVTGTSYMDFYLPSDKRRFFVIVERDPTP